MCRVWRRSKGFCLSQAESSFQQIRTPSLVEGPRSLPSVLEKNYASATAGWCDNPAHFHVYRRKKTASSITHSQCIFPAERSFLNHPRSWSSWRSNFGNNEVTGKGMGIVHALHCGVEAAGACTVRTKSFARAGF